MEKLEGRDKMKRLSDEQLEILEAIDDYIKASGYSPSVRDICEMTGRNSPGTIHYHLKNLKKLGYINYDDKLSRTIRIIRKAEK